MAEQDKHIGDEPSGGEKELSQPGKEMVQKPGVSAEVQVEKSVGLVEIQYVRLFEGEEKLQLECGEQLGPIDVAFETYGKLNERRDNAILLLHALSGDAHVAGRHKADDKKAGWWEILVGPGKAFDTNKYFVIGTNCLGGCMGTTGPSSVNPETDETYGLSFPMITISDMVEVQLSLMDHLGIDKLLAVAGGSMGGMQALDWGIRYPDRIGSVLAIATTPKLSAQGIAFDAVGRNAILKDRNFQGGGYYKTGKEPDNGLAVARMVGHITYLSEEAMHAKFGRQLRQSEDYRYDFENEFSVETYLDYQGSVFVDRFDANTYLYFSKAMDYFDLERQYGSIEKAFSETKSRFLVISFTSDWLFPPQQNQELVNALLENGKDVSYCNINSPYGHDSFLLETKIQGSLISGFLRQTYEQLQAVQSKKRGEGAGVETNQLTTNQANWYGPGSIFTGERVDHRHIAQLIEPNSTVLDLGCGDGQLLAMLQKEKNISGMGVTLGEEDVVICAENGVSVVEYNLDKCISLFGKKSYDYVVLSQTMQVIKQVPVVLRELLRVGRQVIVSFPNFAYWRGRMQFVFKGRAPVWKDLPYTWFDKPDESVNYMSIVDFEEFVRDNLHARMVKRLPLSSRTGREVKILPNLFADEAIFVIADK
ncbi:MAG: homoserine O-acetyltransferase [Planctomycetes bacterium]|nr:homoserine O-acetyltransferase [Planctomycetota bacterium]